METHGLAFATCTIKFQENRNDFALGEFTIFYCNLLINMDCKQFLLSHFLYSENTRLVPRDLQFDLQFDLQYFVFPNESGASSTQFLVQAVDGAVASYSVQGNWVVPKELEFRYEDVNMEDLLASLPEGVNGKLLGGSFYRGKRTFSISLRMKRLRCLFPLETSLMCRMCCLWMRKRNGNFRLSVLPRFAVASLLFMMITRRWCMRAKRLRSLLLLRKRLRMLCCLLPSESCLTIFLMVRMC